MKAFDLKGERGISILEVAVALGVILIALTGATQLLSFGFRSAGSSAYMTTALNAARAKLEEIKGDELLRIPTDYPDGSTYTVPDLPEGELKVEYPNGTTSDPLVIRITVRWREKNITRNAILATMVTSK